MEVAFLGLGNLGRAIAKRLKEVFGKEITLYLWTRDISKAELVSSELGAIRLLSPSKIPESVRFIFLCLFDSNAVEETIKKIPVKNKIIIDLTTNFPDKVLNFESYTRENGGEYVESPVLGSVIPASQGRLTAIVACRKNIFDESEKLIKAIAEKIFFIGEEFSKPSILKLINNLVLGSFMLAIGEAVAIGEKMGFPTELIVDILMSGAGKSAILEAKKTKIISKDFLPHFSVSLIAKDLKYLKEVLKEKTGKDDFFFSKAGEIYEEAKKNGFAQLDFSSIYAFILKNLEDKKTKKENHKK